MREWFILGCICGWFVTISVVYVYGDAHASKVGEGMMTKKRLESARRLYSALERYGFDGDEVGALVRIERTLTRWAEAECGDSNEYCSVSIERDEDTDIPYRVYRYHRDGKVRRFRIPDREKGALERLWKIIARHPEYLPYHQTDPRGCSLYILRHDDVPDLTKLDSVYTRGIAVCY